MIERLGDKKKFCKYCLADNHTQFHCPKKPRPTLQTYKGLKVSSSFGGQRKPMKQVGKQGKRTAAAVNAWKKTIKPGPDGLYKCHYCPTRVPYLMAEHMESKTRRPDLRTDHANLVPVCAPCNKAKGSRSHDEVEHRCDV